MVEMEELERKTLTEMIPTHQKANYKINFIKN